MGLLKKVMDRWFRKKDGEVEEHEALALSDSQRLAQREALLQAEAGRITAEQWKVVALYDQQIRTMTERLQAAEARAQRVEQQNMRLTEIIRRYQSNRPFDPNDL
jgi:uncharacterized coiled-coil protein SlyX